MLYKYFSYNENSLSLLVNMELWASQPEKFNDPFDSSFSVNGSEAVRKYLQQKAICCLSETKKNILMWAHYANNHTGFCVGYSKQKLNATGLLEEVNYVDDFPEFSIESLVSNDSKNVRPPERVRLLTTKYIDWQYEREWRLILELNHGTCQNETIYGKLLKIPSDFVNSVNFGCKMPRKNMATIRKILKDLPIQFIEMAMSNDSFELIETLQGQE